MLKTKIKDFKKYINFYFHLFLGRHACDKQMTQGIIIVLRK